MVLCEPSPETDWLSDQSFWGCQAARGDHNFTQRNERAAMPSAMEPEATAALGVQASGWPSNQQPRRTEPCAIRKRQCS